MSPKRPTLARKFKAGDGARYEDNAVVKVGGAEATQTARLWREIKEVKPNGEVVTAVTLEGGRLSLPWGTRSYRPNRPVEVHDARGRVLSFKRSVPPTHSWPKRCDLQCLPLGSDSVG